MSTEEQAYVLRKRDNAAITLTLNRGDHLNPLSAPMMTALQSQLETIARDDDIRVMVMAAAGRAFCAGHDLKQMRTNPEVDSCRALLAQCSRMMLTLQKMPQPVIARVNGIAAAAGCQLVSMCDLAVASLEARFAVSGVNYGLFCSNPEVGLSHNISRKQAMEMLLTGDFIMRRLRWRADWLTAWFRPLNWLRKSADWLLRLSPSRQWQWQWASNYSANSWKWAWRPHISSPGKPWHAT